MPAPAPPGQPLDMVQNIRALITAVAGGLNAALDGPGKARPPLLTSLESTELKEHREIVSYRPALGDPAFDQPVGECGVTCVGTGRNVEPPERASRPRMRADAELHNQVSFGDNMRLDPSCGVDVTAGCSEKLARSLDPARPTWRERMVHHVGSAQLIEAIEIANPVAQIVEFLDDGLVLFGVHDAVTIRGTTAVPKRRFRTNGAPPGDGSAPRP